jgi:rfaE bifunctional protein nucleotidyltransferase chain/domain
MVVQNHNELAEIVKGRQEAGELIVFTNGVFDILHGGHVRYLAQARNLGGALVVAINSDSSVRRLKGDKRPIVGEAERAELLDALRSVDYVTHFSTDTPVPLLEKIRPDIYVKGGDYRIEDLPEARVVKAYGGRVLLLPYLEGSSTSGIIERVLDRYRST